MESGKNLIKLRVAANQNIKEKNYWLNQLGDFEKSFFYYDLPADETKLKENRQFKRIRFKLPDELALKLLTLVNGSDYRMHMVFMAGAAALLNKYYSSSDIVVGMPIYKQETDIEFINTVLALRFQLGENITFKELLLLVRQNIAESTENSNYPIEILMEQLKSTPSISKNPCSLFDISVILENIHDRKYLENIHYNILFSFLRDGQSLEGNLEYNSSLYRKKTIERIREHFLCLLSQCVFNVNLKLPAIEILTGQEKARLLMEFNRKGDMFPGQEGTVIDLFEKQVSQFPHHTALVFKYKQLTYKTLNERANQWAYFLRSKGVKPDFIVGIMMESSLELIIGIFAVLKAGGAYLALDPDYPGKRIDFILKDSAARWLLTAKKLVNKSTFAKEIVFLDDMSLPVRQSKKNPSPGARLFHLAYAVYTSGTSGQPKGILVEHGNLVSYVRAFLEEFTVTAGDIIIQQSSCAFDVFVEELFPILLKGGTIALPGEYENIDINLLSGFIKRNNVTIIDCTPLLLNQLNNTVIIENLPIHTFISGGDVLKGNYINHLQQIGNVYNTYGPSETTVCASYYRCDKPMGANIPIGKPITGYQVYILDNKLALLPINVPGEICIAGAGVTRGYLNRPESTAQKFNHDLRDYPDKKFLRGGPGGAGVRRAPPGRRRLYRTGDLGRWLEDGNIQFLGRNDFQVKIRGYRIELGEIENKLLNRREVTDAFIIDGTDKNGDKYLCAYVVSTQAVKSSMLREYLNGELPDYMVPSFFVQLDKMPLTPNGKVDRKALPEPEASSETEYIAPRDQLETNLAGIWAQVLGIAKEKIGIDDNFFELGGNSLKAVMLTAILERELYIKVPLAEMFVNSTIRGLAKCIGTSGKIDTKDIIKDDNLVLLKKGVNPSKYLFLIHPGYGELDSYIDFCNHFHCDFNIWGIRADRLEGYSPVNISIEEIAKKYIDKMMKVQPGGPFYISGWCIGGVIAFEMSRQLQTIGEKIEFLGLIDSAAPGKERLKSTVEFTLESELKRIGFFFRDRKDIIEKYRDKIKDIEHLWELVVDYLEKIDHGRELIKKLTMKYENLVIPHDENISIKEFIKRLNMSRTFLSAQLNYFANINKEINSRVHYFAAGGSREIIDSRRWRDFSTEPVRFYTIEGDHGSIFEYPDVIKFAKTFVEVLAG